MNTMALRRRHLLGLFSRWIGSPLLVRGILLDTFARELYVSVAPACSCFHEPRTSHAMSVIREASRVIAQAA